MTHYHIIGIAGAGMSAIAHVLLDQGHTVSGSDMQQNALSAALQARGAAIVQGYALDQVAQADALLISSAVRPDQTEVQAATQRGIPILKRVDMWRQWSQQRKVIAVAGTHGKTTTTALITLALRQAGMQPGFLVGATVADLGVNGCWGDPQAPMVIEADEYDRTFLSLSPHIAVITNVELDHVDIYPNEADYDQAFHSFASSVPDPSHVIVCGDDPGVLRAVALPGVIQYGIDEMLSKDPVSCRRALLNWSASNLREADGNLHFELWRYDPRTLANRRMGDWRIRLAGEHNVRNAVATIIAAQLAGAPFEAIAAALQAYRGAGRRFELKGQAAGVTVIDDYAHHPTEVRVNLAAARRRFAGQRIVAYIQPHTYSRTLAMLDEWAQAFSDADIVLVGDIYAARETDTLGIDAQRVAETIVHSHVQAVGSLAQAAQTLVEVVQPGDIVLTFGAGDGYKVGEQLLVALGNA